MADAMLQFHHPGGLPALDTALAMFGLSDVDVDQEYGVVTTNPREGLYVILVKDHALVKVEAALKSRAKHPAEGLFGNPRIEPTAPLRP
jgi:hypothetical protein